MIDGVTREALASRTAVRLIIVEIPDAGNNIKSGKKLHPLSERLASLGIIGVQFKAPFKPAQYDVMLCWSEGFQDDPKPPEIASGTAN